MWSREDQYVDPIPAWFPTRSTGKNNYVAHGGFRIEVKKRPDQKFDGCNVALSPQRGLAAVT